jgi:16S rRNA processing protein RimM
VDLYLTGIILKPKGLKGEVKVQLVTDFLESFLKRKEYYTGRSEDDAVPRKVLSAKMYQGFAYMLFEGIESREMAEAVAGHQVFVTGDALVPLSGDRAYIHELTGLTVYDEEGEKIGTVSDVLNMPAHDVYEILTGTRKVLVPAVEEFVVEIDMQRGRMVLRRFSEFL